MAKKLVAIDANLSEGYVTAGFLEGMSGALMTEQHISSVMDLVFRDLNNEFLEFMDALAASDHPHFHHVYEWDMVGVSTGRLFKPVMIGRGRNRTVSWEWRASKKTVPVAPEAAEVGAKQVHVFVWKAPFMEYNTTGVDIEPKNRNFISAFTRDDNHGLAMIRGPIHVRNPGGQFVQGSFTTAFSNWWGNGEAQMAFEANRKRLYKDLRAMPLGSTARRKKTFSLSVANPAMLIGEGRVEGKRYVESLTKNYFAQAQARLDMMGENNE